MNLTENEKTEKSAKHCMLRKRNTILPYENKRTCVASRFNIKKVNVVKFQ